MNILDFLKNNTPNNKQTEEIVITRFSEQVKENVTLTLQGLDFDHLEEINTNHPGDSNVYVVLDGIKEPNLRDESLMKKYKVAGGYDELMKAIFLPGEIFEISKKVMALSGYSKDSVKKLEKNLQSVQD